jgi:hypothetical protein
MPGHVILETMSLEGQSGMTSVTDRSVYQSVGDRDGRVASGVERGSTEFMERLAELLVKIRNPE